MVVVEPVVGCCCALPKVACPGPSLPGVVVPGYLRWNLEWQYDGREERVRKYGLLGDFVAPEGAKTPG